MSVAYISPVLSAPRSSIKSRHVSFVNKRVISTIESKHNILTYSYIGNKSKSCIKNNKTRYSDDYSTITFNRK